MAEDLTTLVSAYSTAILAGVTVVYVVVSWQILRESRRMRGLQAEILLSPDVHPIFPRRGERFHQFTVQLKRHRPIQELVLEASSGGTSVRLTPNDREHRGYHRPDEPGTHVDEFNLTNFVRTITSSGEPTDAIIEVRFESLVGGMYRYKWSFTGFRRDREWFAYKEMRLLDEDDPFQ